MPDRPRDTPTPGGWPTTRRYPRTIGEAFRDADYACAMQRNKRRDAILARVFGWAAIALAVVLVALLERGL